MGKGNGEMFSWEYTTVLWCDYSTSQTYCRCCFMEGYSIYIGTAYLDACYDRGAPLFFLILPLDLGSLRHVLLNPKN